MKIQNDSLLHITVLNFHVIDTNVFNLKGETFLSDYLVTTMSLNILQAIESNIIILVVVNIYQRTIQKAKNFILHLVTASRAATAAVPER